MVSFEPWLSQESSCGEEVMASVRDELWYLYTENFRDTVVWLVVVLESVYCGIEKVSCAPVVGDVGSRETKISTRKLLNERKDSETARPVISHVWDELVAGSRSRSKEAYVELFRELRSKIDESMIWTRESV